MAQSGSAPKSEYYYFVKRTEAIKLKTTGSSIIAMITDSVETSVSHARSVPEGFIPALDANDRVGLLDEKKSCNISGTTYEMISAKNMTASDLANTLTNHYEKMQGQLNNIIMSASDSTNTNADEFKTKKQEVISCLPDTHPEKQLFELAEAMTEKIVSYRGRKQALNNKLVETGPKALTKLQLEAKLNAATWLLATAKGEAPTQALTAQDCAAFDNGDMKIVYQTKLPEKIRNQIDSIRSSMSKGSFLTNTNRQNPSVEMQEIKPTIKPTK